MAKSEKSLFIVEQNSGGRKLSLKEINDRFERSSLYDAMDAEHASTPLWLDIKTEYIDENLDKVLKYLHSGSHSPEIQDSFYAFTENLLCRRASELLDDINGTPIYKRTSPEERKPQDIFALKLLGASLLVDGSQVPRLQTGITFLGLLAGLSPLFSQRLAELSVRYLACAPASRLPLLWDDIINLQSDILANKMVTRFNPISAKAGRDVFSGKGTAFMDGESVSIAPVLEKDLNTSNLSTAFSVFDDRIRIMVPKSDKLKRSDLDKMDKLDYFTRGFVQQQAKASNAARSLKTYSQGDIFEAVITGFSDHFIEVQSIDDKYCTFIGKVAVRNSILFYGFTDFQKYLREGDIIPVKLEGVSKGTCSIDQEFVEFIVTEYVDPDIGGEVLAVCTDTLTDKKGTEKNVWFTYNGYPAYSFANEEVSTGDFALIRISSHGQERYLGYVNAEYLEKTDETFDIDLVRQESIRDFTLPSSKENDRSQDILDSGVFTQLYRILLAYQQTLSKPSERYRFLCVSRILAEMTGNKEDAGYIDFISDYLENLVLFAKGDIDGMKAVSAPEYISSSSDVIRRSTVIDVLKCFGKNDESDRLGDIIATASDPLLVKIAILVQSCNRIGDVIDRSMQNVIKREIVRMLAIETESETDLEEENGIYLGIENSRQEFKTSFFHAPESAKEQRQCINVFRGVCAFLNSQAGGTLYLGVNDLGYVSGIDDDIKFMEKTIPGSYHGVDGYIRYITDTAKKYFELEVLTNMDIVSMYDSKVLAINVIPYMFKIVELEKEAFIRLNNESVRMTDTLRRQILSQKYSSLSEKKGSVNTAAIKTAIQERRQVIFHGYSSSSSGTKSDRHLEPFAFTKDFSHVWCYDTEKKRNAIFRTQRIGSVEITSKSWEFEKLHHQEDMDAFHKTGRNDIHAILNLDLMARNLLVEEYPDAEKSLIRTEDHGCWILDIVVHSIEGLARFYMGLAANIQIVDAPELQEYVRKYVESNLK